MRSHRFAKFLKVKNWKNWIAATVHGIVAKGGCQLIKSKTNPVSIIFENAINVSACGYLPRIWNFMICWWHAIVDRVAINKKAKTSTFCVEIRKTFPKLD